MEFSNSVPVTLDVIPAITESNIKDFQRLNFICCPKCVIDLINFIIFMMSSVIFTALPIVEIVIGINYVNDCSMNDYIPIYLIVTGFISIIILTFAIFGSIFIWPSIVDLKSKTIKSVWFETGIIIKVMLSIAILLFLFGLAWFIAGNIWVFSGRLNVQYTNPIGYSNTYCNRIVYLTGFWSIIIKYIWIWIIICRLNCYVCSDIRKILINYNQV